MYLMIFNTILLWRLEWSGGWIYPTYVMHIYVCIIQVYVYTYVIYMWGNCLLWPTAWDFTMHHT